MSLALIDQLLSSGSNVLLTFGAARLLTDIEFGAFSFAAISAILALSLGRAAVNETLLVRLTSAGASPEEQMRTGLGAATVTAIPLAGLSLIVGIVAMLVGSDFGGLMAVLALALPLMLMQDTVRYVALVAGRPRTAVVTDGVWLAGVVLTLGVANVWPDLRSPLFLFAAWCFAGAFAGLVAMWQWGTLPRAGAGVDFLRINSDMAVRYTADSVASTGSSQVSYYIVSAFAGLASLGALRGAQALFGPLNVLFGGVYLVVVPEAHRVREQGFAAMRKVCLLASAAMTLLSMVLLALLLVIPDSVGSKLLGATWYSVSDVLLPVGLASVAGGAVAGALAGLRAIDNPRIVLNARLWTIPSVLILPTVGAIVDGAVGMSWGLFASSVLTCAIYWVAFLRSGGTERPGSIAASVEAGAILDQEMVISAVLESIVSPSVAVRPERDGGLEDTI